MRHLEVGLKGCSGVKRLADFANKWAGLANTSQVRLLRISPVSSIAPIGRTNYRQRSFRRLSMKWLGFIVAKKVNQSHLTEMP